MAIAMFAIVAPLQLLAGHDSGKLVLEHQPLKTAAIEAYWKSGPDQPQSLIGLPDRTAGKTHFELAIPGIGNLVQGVPKDQSLKGLDAFPRADWPVVGLVYWSFRVMVGLGLAMIGLGVWGVWLIARKRLDESTWFLRAAVAMGPAGFVAVIAGWIVAEVGRQPWTIYGVLRTADSASPVGPGQVSASLLAFMVIYAVVFSAGAVYILRLINQGPSPAAEVPPAGEGRAPGTPLAAAPPEPEA